MNRNIWEIFPSEDYESHRNIFDFLQNEYCRIFSADTMNNEQCIIFNDKNTNIPRLIINCNPIKIRLAQEKPRCWAQTVFQLSHELCHYAIRQHKKDKNFTLSWFEEIVCEAMLLYALQFASQNWEQCKLSEYAPTFAVEFGIYLKKRLLMPGTDLLQRCTSVELLKQYEENHCYDRETHRNERNALYFAISTCPDVCRYFCDYTKYVDKGNEVTIDFLKWESDNPSPIIKVLHKLQPCCNVAKESSNA